jgi:hypothetical protein
MALTTPANVWSKVWMRVLAVVRPVLPILIGVSLMLSLSMGLRQSFGIFMQPLTRCVAISVPDFTLAIAIQNLTWDFYSRWLGHAPRASDFDRS